jgi:CDP-glucose 4,6-dehydratase
MAASNFWQDRRVFITGHTGFKGSWLSLWLAKMGAKITGYALDPQTDPNLFSLCQVNKSLNSIIADIRDRELLKETVKASLPEVIFHLAAQPLVRRSYQQPAETFEINVVGTVNLLEAVRECQGIKAVVIVTSDKCYENKGKATKAFKESDPLGGHDPYSSSKACSELVTAAYRSSFFNPTDYQQHGVGIASARAGNVIGGGDWAADRLVPDFIRAILKNDPIIVRNPKAVRPWQHVLEPLGGYLLLAEKLFSTGEKFAQAWNFGPHGSDAKSVEWIVNRLCEQWGEGSCQIDRRSHPHEAHYLQLDISKAKKQLGWQPHWKLDKAIEKVVEWTRAYKAGEDLRKICYKQIEEYSGE